MTTQLDERKAEAAGAHAHGDAHADYPFLEHHFDTPQQQFDAGKLGMWIFLVTEVLFFGGLFCAYAVYRAHHPEVFVQASEHLDVRLGAINTVVLLFSSLTIAWAVRCAQLGNRRGLVALLAITLVCAVAFLGVKYFEYEEKITDGKLWGASYTYEPGGALAPADAPAAEAGAAVADAGASSGADKRVVGLHIFFSIYFFMTGIHALHILIGIGVIGWILRRAARGEFGPKYFGPVDNVALYWHVVDLIWIFLFPLLYLIN